MGRRNPNGYGSVSKLKGNRKRPYVVRVTKYTEDGHAKQTPIAYAESETEAMLILAEYNKSPWGINRDITFNDLFKKWKESKSSTLSTSNLGRLNAAFKWCDACYGMKYREIKSYHMQRCVDQCPRGTQTKASIQALFGHLDRFAFEIDVISKMYSQLVINTGDAPVTNRTPFTREQINDIWKHKDNRDIQIVLIYLYTGFRRSELLTLKRKAVDLENRTMTGGLKTAAGKNRVVPIHSKIYDIVKSFYDEGNEYLINNGSKPFSDPTYYKSWNRAMELVGISRKVPHECRHTVETELDNQKANKKCIDMILGHASKDVGTKIYNHKTLEQLKEAIELLP